MAKIDKLYHSLLEEILEEGVKREDPNRKGVYRIQIPDAKIKYNFKDGFPAISTKKLYWKGVVGELIWFLRGDTNIKYLIDNDINIWNKDGYNFYLDRYDKYPLGKNKKSFEEWLDKQKEKRTKYSGNLGRIYGAQWRKWNLTNIGNWDSDGITESYTDQISNLIKGLRENPLSSQHIVTAWNPAELDQMALPPCHWSFEILVEPLSEDNRVDIWCELNPNDTAYLTNEIMDKLNIPKYQFTLKWHQRSVDSFLGKM